MDEKWARTVLGWVDVGGPGDPVCKNGGLRFKAAKWSRCRRVPRRAENERRDFPTIITQQGTCARWVDFCVEVGTLLHGEGRHQFPPSALDDMVSSTMQYLPEWLRSRTVLIVSSRYLRYR